MGRNCFSQRKEQNAFQISNQNEEKSESSYLLWPTLKCIVNFIQIIQTILEIYEKEKIK